MSKLLLKFFNDVIAHPNVVVDFGFYSDVVKQGNINRIVTLAKSLDKKQLVVSDLHVVRELFNNEISLEDLVLKVQDRLVYSRDKAIAFIALSIKKGFIDFTAKYFNIKRKHVLVLIIIHKITK